MPGTIRNRKFARRRTTRRIKPWYARKYSPMEIASKAMSGVKYLKSLVNAELKFRDHTISTMVQAGYAVNYISLLTDIPVGDTAITRDGSSVLMKSLSVKGSMMLPTIATTGSTLRVLIIMDKNDNAGVIPPVTEVCEGVNLSSVLAPFANLNKDNVGRFVVLYSKLLTLNVGGSAQLAFSFYKKFYQHHLRFDSVGATGKGHIYLYVISDRALADVGNCPFVSAQSRITFYDN